MDVRRITGATGGGGGCRGGHGGGICSSLVCDHASLYLYQTPDRRLVVVALMAASVVVAVEVKGCVMVVLGILRSDNGDVHEKVAENRLCILSNFIAIIPSRPVT